MKDEKKKWKLVREADRQTDVEKEDSGTNRLYTSGVCIALH